MTSVMHDFWNDGDDSVMAREPQASPWRPAQTDLQGRERKGDWIQTSESRMFWPLDPRADEIFPNEIAHGLSMIPRFGGHCYKFYSVAEHCYLMAQSLYEPELELWCLLHDAAEAYIGDMVRPLKRMLPEFCAIEDGIMVCVKERFGLVGEMPAEVKKLDNEIMMAEADHMMVPFPKEWGITDRPLPGFEPNYWTPAQAKEKWLIAFRNAFLRARVGDCANG